MVEQNASFELLFFDVNSFYSCLIFRQLDGSKVHSSHMDGFCQHLQNEQKESFHKQETDLHFYSSNDIDM